MLSIQLNELPLRTTCTAKVPNQRAHSTFPFLLAQENENISLVYFELNPGDQLGTHTGSDWLLDDTNIIDTEQIAEFMAQQSLWLKAMRSTGRNL